MSGYVGFENGEGPPLLVEVVSHEVAAGGLVKAGLRERATGAVSAAATSFDDAVRRAVQDAARAFVSATGGLPSPPREVEITFGLKATGEVGNMAIAKGGAEANFTVRLVWDASAQGER